MARDNRTLDKFHLDGIPPAPRGVPQIEVEFDIDANGILHVRASDKATGKEQKVRIEQSTGLTEEDIQRMQEEAERFKDQDRKAQELADARNTGDQVVYQARKLLKDNEGKVEEADATEARRKADELEELIKGEDRQAILRATEELQGVLSRIGEKLYKAASAGAGAPGGGGAGEPEATGEPAAESGDQVVDADYEVKD